jgi:hypothetical protein
MNSGLKKGCLVLFDNKIVGRVTEKVMLKEKEEINLELNDKIDIYSDYDIKKANMFMKEECVLLLNPGSKGNIIDINLTSLTISNSKYDLNELNEKDKNLILMALSEVKIDNHSFQGIKTKITIILIVMFLVVVSCLVAVVRYVKKKKKQKNKPNTQE